MCSKRIFNFGLQLDRLISFSAWASKKEPDIWTETLPLLKNESFRLRHKSGCHHLVRAQDIRQERAHAHFITS